MRYLIKKKTQYIIRNYIVKGVEITKQVDIIKESVKNIIPFHIKYGTYIYSLIGRITKSSKRITWHCQNYRKIKDKPKDNKKFCSATIQGIREDNSDSFKFYEKNPHSNLCLSLY